LAYGIFERKNGKWLYNTELDNSWISEHNFCFSGFVLIYVIIIGGFNERKRDIKIIQHG